jgi:hypothetical protein
LLRFSQGRRSFLPRRSIHLLSQTHAACFRSRRKSGAIAASAGGVEREWMPGSLTRSSPLARGPSLQEKIWIPAFAGMNGLCWDPIKEHFPFVLA